MTVMGRIAVTRFGQCLRPQLVANQSEAPFVRTHLKTLAGLQEVVSFIENKGMLRSSN